MSIGRNDPCPCGSGKKYKKCCGKVEGSAIHRVMQEELENLQRELIDFAMENYSHEMRKQYQSLLHTHEVLRKNSEVYLVAFEIWFILTQPVKNGRTVLEEFVARRAQTISRERTRDIFLTWPNVKFAAGTVKAVRENIYEIEDILSGEKIAIRARRQVPVDEVFVVGGLLPFEEEYIFFMIDFHFERHIAPEAAKWLAEQYEQSGASDSQAFLAENWLSILEGIFAIHQGEEQEETDREQLEGQMEEQPEEILGEAEVVSEEPAAGAEDIVWEKESQEKTAEALAAFLKEEEVEADKQQEAIALLHQYCQQENPTIRKPEVYVAAVYSLLQSRGAVASSYSNSELASRLDVSASGLSKRVKDMEKVVSGNSQ